MPRSSTIRAEGRPSGVAVARHIDSGLFHHFHQDWTIELCRTLNAGRLPPGFTALTDQQTGGPIPDVLALHRGSKKTETGGAGGTGLAVAATPPRARFVDQIEEDT